MGLHELVLYIPAEAGLVVQEFVGLSAGAGHPILLLLLLVVTDDVSGSADVLTLLNTRGTLLLLLTVDLLLVASNFLRVLLPQIH